MTPETKIRGVFERDIDLLLLEELVVSPQFRHLFLAACGLPTESRLLEASRSVNTSNGESDLELMLADGQRQLKVLIENKIDAALQPLQDERYSQRARTYQMSGQCDDACTVLVAPQTYQATHQFNYRINYEDILRRLETADPASERSRFKATIVASALDRGASGWSLVPDRTTTEFWQNYWQLASATAPELGMARPGQKPATSGFVRFRPARLRRGVALIHKAPYGHVDLQFAGLAPKAAEFAAEYSGRLEPGMLIAAAGKSLVVRLTVPCISLHGSFTESEPNVRQALDEAKRLLAWHVRGAT